MSSSDSKKGFERGWIPPQFAAVMPITRDRRALVLLRGSTAPAWPLMWNFPGGTIDKTDAKPIDAALRECEEEAGKGITEAIERIVPLGGFECTVYKGEHWALYAAMLKRTSAELEVELGNVERMHRGRAQHLIFGDTWQQQQQQQLQQQQQHRGAAVAEGEGEQEKQQQLEEKEKEKEKEKGLHDAVHKSLGNQYRPTMWLSNSDLQGGDYDPVPEHIFHAWLTPEEILAAGSEEEEGKTTKQHKKTPRHFNDPHAEGGFVFVPTVAEIARRFLELEAKGKVEDFAKK